MDHQVVPSIEDSHLASETRVEVLSLCLICRNKQKCRLLVSWIEHLLQIVSVDRMCIEILQSDNNEMIR